MPSSVKQMYVIVAGVSLLALLGFVFTPHVFAAWIDAPNNPPTYGATGCSPFPCSEDDFKPVTQTTANQSKQGRLAIGTSAAPAYTVDVAGDVNITGSYRINGVSLTQGGGSVLSGAGTANYLSKWTNGTALQDSLVFDNGTNVGIGTQTFTALPFPLTPADNKLEVGGVIVGKGFFDQDDPTYYLDPHSTVSGNLAGTLTTGGINTGTLKVTGGTLAPGNVLTSDEFGNATWGQGGYWTLSGTDIYSNNTGNVGIGTTAPTAKLDVNGTAKVITLQFADGTTQTTATVDIPAGAVVYFNLASCPSGWVAADGAGGTPDLRGEFLRGLDSGRGVDIGRILGSWQADMFKSHTHSYNTKGTTAPQSGSSTWVWYSDAAATTGATGGIETRPRNIALLACIKASGGGGGGGGSGTNYWTLSGADIYTNNTGNVGIGTTAPTAKLDVNGTAKVITLQFADGTTQTTAGSNFAAVNQYTSATTLTVANDGGRLIELGGGGSYNLTLPISSSGSGGKRISFVAYGGGPFYLVPQGSDCLWLTTKCVGYVTIASPGYTGVTSNGVGAWIVDSGTPLDGSIGIGQTWQNVTAYRTPGTTYANSPEYTNSTGKPIQISVIFRSDTGANNGYIYVDGLEVWHFNSGNYVGNMPATVIIPSGSKYRVSTTAPLIRSWNELR